MALAASPAAPQQVRLDKMEVFMKHSILVISPLTSHHIQLRDEKKKKLAMFFLCFIVYFSILIESECLLEAAV